MTDQPIISIIMPCYNAALHLPQSVGSVLAQTFTHWELIAIDDGSKDGTLAWLNRQHDARIRTISQTNQGVSAARNAGLGMAHGKYVAFLDADDAWAPTFLKKLLATLEAQPEAVLAYCGWQNVGLPGPRGEPFIPPDYETPSKHETLFAGCRWPIHAVLAHREAVVNAGGFNPQLKNAEDYALWLEIAGTKPIIRVPEVLAFYHFHSDNQASANKGRAALHFLSAQKDYLARHPEFETLIGASSIRQIIYGGLLKSGYDCYWHRDLVAARMIFKYVMSAGYGKFSDWRYMLPALLPLSLHKWLLNFLSSDKKSTESN
jgi:glycosyltransferase involved in cell wall biosynthesis